MLDEDLAQAVLDGAQGSCRCTERGLRQDLVPGSHGPAPDGEAVGLAQGVDVAPALDDAGVLVAGGDGCDLLGQITNALRSSELAFTTYPFPRR